MIVQHYSTQLEASTYEAALASGAQEGIQVLLIKKLTCSEMKRNPNSKPKIEEPRGEDERNVHPRLRLEFTLSSIGIAGWRSGCCAPIRMKKIMLSTYLYIPRTNMSYIGQQRNRSRAIYYYMYEKQKMSANYQVRHAISYRSSVACDSSIVLTTPIPIDPAFPRSHSIA